MKNTKSYQEAVEFLNRLPLGTTELDVIINYAKDEVDIHYKVQEGSSIPHYITSKAIQYIRDIEKAINKEHEVPLEVVDTTRDLHTHSFTFVTALNFLQSLTSHKVNELEVVVHKSSVTIVIRENNDNMDYLSQDQLNRWINNYLDEITKAKKVLDDKEKAEQLKFEESIKESPMPKVKSFFENILTKLEDIDLTPIGELKEKAEQIIKDQAYDQWNDSPFGQSVIEMKKLLESLDAINEDSFLEKIKSKVQAYNRQVLALRETRNELNKMFTELPNKEKFSVNYDKNGFVDVVQMPAVHLINRISVYVTHSHESIHIYECDAEGYYSLLDVEPGSPTTAIMDSFSKERIITLEKVPFERFTITKSGSHTFAVEVIDKPVF